MIKVQLKKSVLALLCLGVVALIAPAPAHAQLEKVVVTNTSANPVPTVAQGTTQVAGSVQIQGTTTVSGTVTIGNTAAAPALVRDVNAAAATHLGRKASEIVSLSGLLNSSGEIFFLRSLPNGTAAAFTVPAGKVFVITDIHWQIEAGNAGDVVRLVLNVENLANPSLTRRVFNSVLTLNTAGVNGSNERLAAGILVSSAATIRANLTTPSGAFNNLFLIGYLVPEE